MPFFNRPRRLSSDFIAVPRELTAAELIDEARIAELDERIFKSHRSGEGWMTDVLLDRRLRIRPARVAEVPVIPGRS